MPKKLSNAITQKVSEGVTDPKYIALQLGEPRGIVKDVVADLILAGTLKRTGPLSLDGMKKTRQHANWVLQYLKKADEPVALWELTQTFDLKVEELMSALNLLDVGELIERKDDTVRWMETKPHPNE